MRNASSVIDLPAYRIAREVREKSVSPVEVVEAFIHRIRKVNPTLRAIVEDDFERAHRAAKAAEDAVMRGASLGPLHGVPFTVKDSLDVSGLRSTCGLTARREHVARSDATVVSRMKRAGGILLGKTNVPDACWDQETENLVYGRTSNPWDPSRTAGGSSGGEAAALAAHASPLGLGSDIAGSIRLPAHFTGIVGLRPTSGTVPEEGQWPLLTPTQRSMNAIGPMARRVEDAALALSVLRDEPELSKDIGNLEGAKVAHWFDDGVLARADDDVTRAVITAVSVLTRQGRMRSVAGAPAARRFSVLGWSAYQGEEDRLSVNRGFGGGESWSPAAEVVRALRGRARVSRSALLYWFASDVGNRLGQRLRIDGSAWRRRLQTELRDLVGPQGITVSPVFPTAAPLHGYSLRQLAPLTSMGFQAWVNLAGLPALVLPIAMTASGLPVGVQLVAGEGREDLLLSAGMLLQRELATEFWRAPLEEGRTALL